MATPTQVRRCDIVRDMAAATACGLCAGAARGCPAGLSPSVCGIPGAANARMALFADQLNPISSVEKSLEESDYASAIAANELALATAYPRAEPGATSISWPDFESCKWNPDGQPGGPFNNVYFERDDIVGFGMAPVYPIGGRLASGTLWRPPKSSPLPVAVDYIANPDLAAIIIFVLLVLIFAGIVRAILAHRANASRANASRANASRANASAYSDSRGASAHR